MAGVGAGAGVAVDAWLAGEATGVAVVMATRTTPEGGDVGGIGVTDSKTDTGVTTVPIGAEVGVAAVAAVMTGLDWHPLLKLAIRSPSTRAWPFQPLR